MAEKFDIQRFLSILRISRGKLRLKGLFIIAIAMVLVFAFIGNSSGSKHNANTIFFVFMIMRSNGFFMQFAGRGGMTYYLMIPATRLEKFAALLTSLFFDPIVFYLIAICFEKLLMLISPTYFSVIGSMDQGVFVAYILFFSSLILVRLSGRLLRNLQVMTILYIALFGAVFLGIAFLFKQMGLMPYLKANGISLMILLSIGMIGLSYRFFQKLEVKAFTVTND